MRSALAAAVLIVLPANAAAQVPIVVRADRPAVRFELRYGSLPLAGCHTEASYGCTFRATAGHYDLHVLRTTDVPAAVVEVDATRPQQVFVRAGSHAGRAWGMGLLIAGPILMTAGLFMSSFVGQIETDYQTDGTLAATTFVVGLGGLIAGFMVRDAYSTHMRVRPLVTF